MKHRTQRKGLAVLCILAMIVQLFAVMNCSTIEADASELSTNGNGGKTDVGMWYVTYNTESYWKYNFNDPDAPTINYRSLVSENPITYGIPDSGDPDVIDFHLSKMAEAQVDFIVLELTNGGLTTEMQLGTGGSEWIVDNAKLTCERIQLWNETHEWKIKYAVAIGAYTIARKDADGLWVSVREIIEMQAEAVYEDFYLKYGEDENYYTLDGKPLLVCHDWAANVLTEATGSANAAGGLYDSSGNGNSYSVSYNADTGDKTWGNKFTLRSSQSGQAGSYGWSMSGTTQVHSEVELVIPGWGSILGDQEISREDGARYQRNWDVVLDNDSPRIVMVGAFNDYNEKMAVFPTYTGACVGGETQWVDEDGNQDPYMYWDMTIDNIKALRAKNGDSGLPDATAVIDPDADAYQEDINVLAGAQCDTVSNITDEDCTHGGTIALTSGETATIELELQEAAGLNKLIIYSDDADNDEGIGFVDNIAIDVLSHGVWKRVTEVHAIIGEEEDTDDTILPEDDMDGDTSCTYVFTFNQIVAEKIRISGNNAIQGNSQWLLYEIEGYYDASIDGVIEDDVNDTILPDDDLGTDTSESTSVFSGINRETTTNLDYNIPFINILQEATVTSHNFQQDYRNAGYKLSYLNDGVAADGKAGNDAIIGYQSDGIASYELWLDSESSINEMYIYYSSVHEIEKLPHHITIDAQLEDGTWQRLVAKYDLPTGGESGFSSQLKYTFPTVTTQRIRISANKAGNANATNWRVTEVEGYYNLDISVGVYDIDESSETNAIPAVEFYAGAGDVNVDGTLNSDDRLAMRTFLVGIASKQDIAADQNCDKKVNPIDLVRTIKSITQ